MQVFRLLDYQQDVVNFMLQTPKCAVWSPMGAGKTGMALSYFKALKAKVPHRMLVVSPLSVIEQWQSEVKKFSNFKDLRVCVLHGKDFFFEYTLFNNPDIWLTNYESLPKLVDAIQKSKSVRFNVVVFDESSKLKNGRRSRKKKPEAEKKAKKSIIFNSAVAICELKFTDRIVLLSATPNPNSYLDLWSQYYLLDQGERLGKFITHFRSQYFTQAHYSQFVYTIKQGVENEITQKVADITIRVTEDQIPEKPELLVQFVPFTLSKPVFKKYKTLEKELLYVIDELKDATLDNTVTAKSVTTKITKCRQFISGFIYDHETETTHEVHNEKITILKDYLESFDDTPVIIAYNYIHEREMLLKAIPKARCLGSGMRQEDFNNTVAAWNAQKIHVLLCNPASVSHGLNLQHGGNHIIWYSLTYSYEAYTQLIGRLHRTGQKNNVHNHILLANDTLDRVIYEKLQLKDQSQQAFFDLLSHYKRS